MTWGNLLYLKQAFPVSLAAHTAYCHGFHTLDVLSLTHVLQKPGCIGGPFIYAYIIAALRAFCSFLHNIISLFLTFVEGNLGFYEHSLGKKFGM